MLTFKSLLIALTLVTPTPAMASTATTTSSVVVIEQRLPPIMEKVRWCESRDVATATTPLSSAKGLFQFLDGTWNYYGKKLWGDNLKNKDVFNPKDSTDLAIFVYNLNGLKDWSESKSCWSSPSDG